MVNIEKAIVVEFNKRLFLNGLHKGFTVKCRTGELIFHFKGLIIEDKETSNYIARYMQNMLDEINRIGGDLCRILNNYYPTCWRADSPSKII